MHLPQNIQTRRIIFFGGLLLAAGTIWLIVWLLSFRFVSVDPETKVSTVITQVTFTFSKKLSEKTITGASVTPATNGVFIVNNNQLIFKPTDDLVKGKLSFDLKNITAEGGETITSVHKELSVEYVEYNALSETEKKRQVNESGSGQERFALLNGFLPHATYNYTLDYIQPLPDEKTMALTVDVYRKDDSETQAVYIARMEQAYRDVMIYIETNKGTNSITDYEIFYNNDYLSRYNSIPSNPTDGG